MQLTYGFVDPVRVRVRVRVRWGEELVFTWFMWSIQDRTAKFGIELVICIALL